MEKHILEAKQLRRIIVLLKLLSWEMEFFAMSDDMPETKRKKWDKIYRKDRIEWVLRDILTSTTDSHAFDEVTEDLNSEQVKDLQLWMDIGINCKNLEEIIKVLMDSVEEEKRTALTA